MIENPGFPAKYGHWLKLFVWPVPFTSRPALTAGSISVLKVWKAPNQTTARKMPENPQLGSIIPNSVQDLHHQGIVTGTTVPRFGAIDFAHWFFPLRGGAGAVGGMLGAFKKDTLIEPWLQKLLPWELAQGITYPLLPDEQWKKTWLF